MRTSLVVAMVVVAVVALSPAALAINITYRAPNAACYIDPANTPIWGKWEFDNPLKGNEHILGHKVLQWRDAGYYPASANPYEDWIVHPQGGVIDGNASEIWMRDNTIVNQWIETSTIPCTIIAVSLTGDGNDGLAEVWIDNMHVFSADMGSVQSERVIILVKGLQYTGHNVEVRALGPGAMGGADVATFGAAALDETEVKWEQPPEVTNEGTIYNGWNEPSYSPGPQAAADDWVCDTTDPVKDIHWWGSFENWKKAEPPSSQPAYFHLSIWTDVPRGPNAPFSHPGQCVWQYDAHGVNPVFAGWDYDPVKKQIETCYKYDLILPEENWFRQMPEPTANIYWLCIQAVYPSGETEYPWGWKTRPREPNSMAPDAAVRMWMPFLPAVGAVWPGGAPLIVDDQQWDLAFELTTSGSETMIKWDQPPVWEGQFIYGWDEKSLYNYRPIVADDWLCADMNPVSDVHWWGSYLEWMEDMPPQPAPLGFYVGIWTDVPSPPEPFSHPGKMLKQWYVPRAMLNEHFVGVDYHPDHGYEACFKYDFAIPEEDWFRQEEPNTIYWLSIAADYGSIPPMQFPWGWKTRPHFFQDDAVRMMDPAAPIPGSMWMSGEPIKDRLGVSWDMAFQITSSTSYEYYKWQQPPVTYEEAPRFNGWDEKSVWADDQIVGDDWPCESHHPVTDVHWWGSFLGWSSEHVPQLPDRFHINIWDDVPSPPEPWSHPGKCVHHIVVPINEVSCVFAGWDIDPRDPVFTTPEACFKFEVDLRPEQWFYQPREEMNIYWVTIAAEYNILPEHLFGLKTRPSYFQDDAVAVNFPTWPEPGMIYESGNPLEFPVGKSWDIAFKLTTLRIGTLTFSPNVFIPNHTWQPGNQSRNNMLSLSVSADLVENISWDTVTLRAFGRGNDQTDIASVDVWLDTGVNIGAWDPGDTWIGTGAYPADNGTVTINIVSPPPLGAPVIVPAGGVLPVVITYTMAAGATAGESYYFTVVDATGTGQSSGQSITQPNWVLGLPLNSARKVMSGLKPISIAQAKRLPPGTPFMLQDRFVTADFQPLMDLFYITDRGVTTAGSVQNYGICGIGVDTSTVYPGAVTLGDKATIYGECQLLHNSEMVVKPDIMSFAPGQQLRPLAMNNMWTGAGLFGYQPGVSDDGSNAPPAYGLNTVGLLVRAWGQVQGYGNIDIGGGVIGEVAWIWDGSKVIDGFSSMYDGIAVLKPSDWVGDAPAVGSYLGVAGILRAIPSPSAKPVRLLCPRSSGDIVTHYTPPM